MPKQRAESMPTWVSQRLDQVQACRDAVEKARESLDTRRGLMREKYWFQVHDFDGAFLDFVERAVDLETIVLKHRFWAWASDAARFTDSAGEGMSSLPGPQTLARLNRYEKLSKQVPSGRRETVAKEVQQRFTTIMGRLHTLLHAPGVLVGMGIDVYRVQQWLEPEYSRLFTHAPDHHQLVLVENLERVVHAVEQTRRH